MIENIELEIKTYEFKTPSKELKLDAKWIRGETIFIDSTTEEDFERFVKKVLEEINDKA